MFVVALFCFSYIVTLSVLQIYKFSNQDTRDRLGSSGYAIGSVTSWDCVVRLWRDDTGSWSWLHMSSRCDD